jgi:hypothetical protein
MVDAPAILPSINFSDRSDAQMGTTVAAGPEASPNQPVEWSLDKRIYRTMARSYIQEHQKRTARTKTAKSIYITVISTAFFIAMMAIVYLSAR